MFNKYLGTLDMQKSLPKKQEPKYRRLKRIIEGRIRHGHYKSGTQLPSETALAAKYKMSRQSVRQAHQLLEQEGWIRREQGRGTIICDPADNEAGVY